MSDIQENRTAIVLGLKKELNIPVIRSNQTGPAPAYPYLSYTITTLINDSNGTWGEYKDNYHRKPFTQVWSITVQSDDASECMELCLKARNWIDHTGTVYLQDNEIIVQSVGAVNNRDNLITVDYEHRMGFDVTFWYLNEVEVDQNTEYIDEMEFDFRNI